MSQSHDNLRTPEFPRAQRSQKPTDASIDAQANQLLGAYPLASGTPTTHVARHLSNLTISPIPPTYLNPSYYGTEFAQSDIAQYTSEISFLSSRHVPQPQQGYERTYFNANRNTATQMLDGRVEFHNIPNDPFWSRTERPSMFKAGPFAQTILQHTSPSNLYPTPPPFAASSSSLANALGSQPSRPTPIKHKPADSEIFFDNFLRLASADLPARKIKAPSTSPPTGSSPDPLANYDSSPLTSITPQSSPQKRKVIEVLIETPSKRPHSFRPVSPDSTPVNSETTSNPRKLEMFVEVSPPPKAWTTPLKKKNSTTVSHDTPDLGGYGSGDESDYQTHRSNAMLFNGPRSTGKRTTGERDDRAPIEKFMSILEDIFEAEDNLPPDAEVSDLPVEYFSATSTDSNRPLLHPSIVKRITKQLSKFGSRRRNRLSFWDPGMTPGQSGSLGELDVGLLSRILKMLERSVIAAEDVDPFPLLLKDSSQGSELPRISPSPEDFAGLSSRLEIARDGILAVDCCTALLTIDRLPKQVYSEELIATCLTSTKNVLEKIAYRVAEGPTLDNEDALLTYLMVKGKDSNYIDTSYQRTLLIDVFTALTTLLGRLKVLISSEFISMSDSIIIQAVYIAIGPFFVVEGCDALPKGNKANVKTALDPAWISAMRALRLESLSLIRSIFAIHAEQRSWIIEEILSSLLKLPDSKQKAGQFRLRNGKSIRLVSALLLQLIQTSVHNIRLESRSIRNSSHTRVSHSLNGASFAKSVHEGGLDDDDLNEMHLYLNALDAPLKASKTIILYLTQRSGKSKNTKNSNEAEYRAIFDNLISDMLAVLFWPEWPAASLVLSIVCKFMITSLEDVKTISQNDNNALKALALDHLGVIAGQLRLNGLKVNPAGEAPCKPLDELPIRDDGVAYQRLFSIHREILAHLSKCSSEDSAYESARELHAVMWGQELSTTLNNFVVMLSEAGSERTNSDRQSLVETVMKLRTELRELWDEARVDVFDSSSRDEISKADQLAEEIGMTQSLKNAFEPVLNAILSALDSPPVFMRTKALRAVSQILSVDPTVLSNPDVRRGIESHLMDSSPAVRDAAVELIGKYMVDSPSLAGDYYDQIAERIADTGVGVRKRVIKLMKTFYEITSILSKKIDICTKLVFRMVDEDESVKDLAAKSLEELWFHQNQSASHATRESLLLKTTVVMGVCSNFKEKSSLFEDMLRQVVIASKPSDGEDSPILSKVYDVCDAMVDGLVDPSQFLNFNTVDCVRTIYAFAAAHPSLVTVAKASTLLPYLKNPTSSDEHLTSDYILKILKIGIPRMPKHSMKLGIELQRVLQPMVIKPNGSAGLAALQEAVSCLCLVVQHLTHDFKRLVALLKSCNSRLQHFIIRSSNEGLTAQDMRAVTMLAYILSLLSGNFDFEEIRVECSAELDSISKGPIIDHVYLGILRLYEKFTDGVLRGRLLQCFGFLYKAKPTLMTEDRSSSIMDMVFASPDTENQGRLLKLIQEFLISESTKHTEHLKTSDTSKRAGSSINMEELVGNAQGLAESGVSSAIVQRYLEHIKNAALSQQQQSQTIAVEILTFTVKQGLAHPIQSFPTIVALESSPNSFISNRAIALHTLLHSKHASLLNSGYLKAIRACFDYQTSLQQAEVKGFRSTPVLSAVLSRWYSLVREKRSTKIDFLRGIMKPFDTLDTKRISQDDVNFFRFIMENVSCLEYKTQEEVLTVLKCLTSILSTTGCQVAEILFPSHLLNEFRGSLHDQTSVVRTNVDEEPSNDVKTIADRSHEKNTATDPPLLRTSLIMGMIVILKTYLKNAYSISEEKCAKWILGKKSALGDRPASRRETLPISWDRLPFVSSGPSSTAEMESQKAAILQVWLEDGSAKEAYDEME